VIAFEDCFIASWQYDLITYSFELLILVVTSFLYVFSLSIAAVMIEDAGVVYKAVVSVIKVCRAV
jgi:hypothetical protein